GRAALLATLGDHYDPCMPHPLLLQDPNGGDGGEDRVSVVCATPAVEFSIAQDGSPWFQTRIPRQHRRLLVEMPVHQHGRRWVAIDLDEQQRRSAIDLVNLGAAPRELLPLHPIESERRRAAHVPMPFPLWIEDRTLVRNQDEVL